ncbi:MAG: preprotein translocase subunit YajC [Spirochaetota bacterium]
MDNFFSGLTLLQAAGDATGSMLSTLIPFALVFVIFYFLIIRPQNKKQKEAKKMIEAVKKGDKVVTIGGVHAIVDKVKETTIVLKVDDNTRMEFSKSAVATVLAKSDEKTVEATVEKSPEEKK